MVHGSNLPGGLRKKYVCHKLKKRQWCQYRSRYCDILVSANCGMGRLWILETTAPSVLLMMNYLYLQRLIKNSPSFPIM